MPADRSGFFKQLDADVIGDEPGLLAGQIVELDAGTVGAVVGEFAVAGAPVELESALAARLRGR